MARLTVPATRERVTHRDQAAQRGTALVRSLPQHPTPTPAPHSPAPDTARRTASALVIGSHGTGCARSVVEAIPGLSTGFVSTLPAPGQPVAADVAIGVSVWDPGERGRAFSAWAWAAGVPALEIILGPRIVLVGPLTIPGRVGCGTCARLRLAAVSPEALHFDDGNTLTGPVADLGPAGPVVAAELEALRDIVGRLPCLSRLVDQIVAVDTDTGDSSLHRVIPVSRCAVCGGAVDALPKASSRRLSADDAPEAVLDALAGWVDPLTGVIPSLVMEPDDASDVPVVITATSPHLMERDGFRRRLPSGRGTGLDVSGAILAAVGDAIGHYCPSTPDPARIAWERLEDLHGEVLDPRTFPLYTARQYKQDRFPYVPFDESADYPWTIGTWLDSGHPVWVPAVFSLLSTDIRPRHRLAQVTSGGLAAATDPQDAALAATLDLVGRDAFMAAWMTRCAGRRVEIDESLDPALRRVIAATQTLGADVELYLLPTGAYGTTAVALGLGDGGRWPGVAVGLGTDLDPQVAARRAILALSENGTRLARLMQSGPLPVSGKAQAVRTVLDHAAWYVPVERRSAFDPLRAGAGTISLGDLAATPVDRPLRHCAAELAAAGIRVAVVDVTSPDVATGPFTVMRAVSPDLQPTSYGFGLDRLPVGRLAGRVGVAPDARSVLPAA